VSKYPLYGFWTPLDVIAIVTSCLNFLETLKEKDIKNTQTLKFDKARKEYNIVLEVLSRFEKQVSFYDITSNRVRHFARIDNDFYTENVILKRAKAAEASGLSNKQFLDTLIKEQESKQGADIFLNEMKSIVNKPKKEE